MSSIRWSSDSPAVCCAVSLLENRSTNQRTSLQRDESNQVKVFSIFRKGGPFLLLHEPSFSTSRKPGAAILCRLEDQGPTALGWNGHAFQCLSQTCAWASSLRSKPCVKPVPRASPDRNQPLPAQSPQSAMFSTISYHLSRRRPTMKNSECSFLFQVQVAFFSLHPTGPTEKCLDFNSFALHLHLLRLGDVLAAMVLHWQVRYLSFWVLQPVSIFSVAHSYIQLPYSYHIPGMALTVGWHLYWA